MILNDHEIRKRLSSRITPFSSGKVSTLGAMSVLSFGTGGHGYDLRLGTTAKVLREDYSTPLSRQVIDPKRIGDADFVTVHPETAQGDSYFIVNPGQLFLGVSIEYIHMPDDIMGVVVGKSTYARAGLAVNATPIEAGWKGYLTLELANTTNLPIRVYAGEGIAQVLFFAGDAAVIAYEGKYQSQPEEPVPGRV